MVRNRRGPTEVNVVPSVIWSPYQMGWDEVNYLPVRGCKAGEEQPAGHAAAERPGQH